MTLSSLTMAFAEANRYFNTELSAHFRAIDEGNLLPMLLIFALSFGYGVVHAIGPGHGKALVAGYLLVQSYQTLPCLSNRLFYSPLCMPSPPLWSHWSRPILFRSVR